VAACFLPQIQLRSSRPVSEEMGIQLENELGSVGPLE